MPGGHFMHREHPEEFITELVRILKNANVSRPLLIFVSDIHLTDVLHGNASSKADQLARFWERISAVRGKRPAELCVVGDLFDLVRSPSWFDGRHRPYHGRLGNGVVKQVEAIVDATIRREQGFFDALQARRSRPAS